MKKLSILLLLSLSPVALIKAMDYPDKEAAEKAQEEQRRVTAQKRLDNQLLQAVKAGNLALVQSFLSQGAILKLEMKKEKSCGLLPAKWEEMIFLWL